MPWKYNDRVIREGRSWTNDDGIQHPRNWNIWSEEDKISSGLVWEDDPAPFDGRFWWDAITPKSLDDVPVVDEEGNPVIVDGVQQVLWGLKSEWKEITKKQAASLLSKTDWYIIRNSETGAAIPENVTSYRAAVRTASNTIESAIDNAADHTAFVALWDVPTNSEGNIIGEAPITNWPNVKDY